MVPVKEEYLEYSETCSVSNDVSVEQPRPMEGLHGAVPPPFLNKTYDMIDDPSTNKLVSWSSTSNSFVVWDPNAFAMTVLPRYFKHNNFSSFVRQLNTYGFRKVDPDRWEFANERFLRGQKHLLKTIKRRRSPGHPYPQQQSSNAYLEVGEFGVEGEVDRLKRDKQVLMAELIKLRQEQQNTKILLKAMEERLQTSEQKQQHMMTFLARVLKNPDFLQQLAEQKDKMKELEEAISKKRRRPCIDRGPVVDTAGTSEPAEFYASTDSELEYAVKQEEISFESLTQNIKDSRNNSDYSREQMDHQENMGELNDVFWEELLHDGIVDEKGRIDVDKVENEDVNVLADRLGFLH